MLAVKMLDNTLPTPLSITLLAHIGKVPRPATQAIRQITEKRSSHVASVSFTVSMCGYCNFWKSILPTTRSI